MIDLSKRVQAASIQLAKKGLTAPPTMRVAGAIDISGSMADEIRDGSVQKVFDQLLGIAGKFDDDGSIDMFQFDDRADYIGVCEATNYGSYVKDVGLKSRGGTAYSPCVKLITEKMFGSAAAPAPQKSGGLMGMFAKKPEAAAAAPAGANQMPVLVFFITDGAPLAEGGSADVQFRNIKPAFLAAQQHPIYFQMVGINNQSGQFRCLEMLADDLPNVGFVGMNGFDKTDEQLYGEVLSDELITWVKTTGRGAAQAASA